jgi:hypothetical protein
MDNVLTQQLQASIRTLKLVGTYHAIANANLAKETERSVLNAELDSIYSMELVSLK